MGIEPDIASWVLEFLLRQPLDDRTLDSLLRVLPLPEDNPSLKKSLLLKKLEWDVSRQSVSEATLEVLERLEEMGFRLGCGEVSDTMKRAYCAVAVECTVRVLVNGDDKGDEVDGDDGDDYRRFKFFEGVVRVWRERIGAMEKGLGKGGLGSHDLWIWKDEIEAAVWDDNACDSIVKKRERVDAVEAVKGYLREERGKLGPSFLDMVADRLKTDAVLQGILVVGSDDHVGAKEVPLDSNEETQKDQAHPRNNLVGLRHSKRAKIVHSDGMTTRSAYRNHNPRVSEAISGVSRDSKCDDPAEGNHVEAITGIARESEHHDPVKENHVEAITGIAKESEHHDPMKENHVEAIAGIARESEHHDPVKENHVEAITGITRESKHHDPVKENHVEAISGIARESECLDPAEENHDEVNVFVVDGAGVVRPVGCEATNKPRPSLMERNPSACTYEWDDSIDRSQDDREGYRAKLRLRSPKVLNVSPLKKHENLNFKRRRHRKWSPLEEDTLRTGVQKYGRGNWKFILTAYSDIFQDRTEVDLKDKWRNLTRH